LSRNLDVFDEEADLSINFSGFNFGGIFFASAEIVKLNSKNKLIIMTNLKFI
jgi:hypothetical protein